MDDCICAISTPYGVGALSVIRTSGKDSISLLNKIFKGKNLCSVKPNTIHYGFITNNDELIDEVMVSVFHAPHSYTGENSCEITCHGGIFVTNKVLETLLTSGFRLATRGEFTKRAFLNKKLDLTSLESVMDIIEADNDTSLKSSLNSLRSSLKNKIVDLREKVITLISEIEVNIDYPEYDEKRDLTRDYLITNLSNLLSEMKDVLKDSKIRESYMKGIKTAIVGKPNVGKSSILNYLLGYDKAIVSNIKGTTRDLVEGSINLSEFTLNLVDTAGIRKTDSSLENLGIDRTYKAIEESELVLFVRDVSTSLDEEDFKLEEICKNKVCIKINNKSDLPSLWNDEGISFSTKLNIGIDELKSKIVELFNLDKFKPVNPTLNNLRQFVLFNNAYNSLNNAYLSSLEGMDIELLSIDLNEAFSYLGEIIGLNYPEELLTNLFTKFCLGK